MLHDSTRNAGANQVNVSGSVSPLELISVIGRHKLCMAGWLTLSLGLGAVYMHYALPTYQVVSRVVVQQENSLLNNGSSPRQEKEFLATQGEIIRSPAVVQRAVAAMETQLPIAPDKEPVLAVLDDLTVKPLSGTNVLSVAYRCKDSAAGISLVEAILESYRELLQETGDGTRLEALRQITGSEEKLRSDLESREKQYRDLRKRSPLIGQGKDAMSLQTTKLERLGKELSEVTNRRIDYQHRLSLLSQTTDVRLAMNASPERLGAVALSVLNTKLPSEPSKDVSRGSEAVLLTSYDSGNENVALDWIADVKLTGTPNSAQIFEKLYNAQVRQKELAQRCGPDHPAMRAALEEIAAWKEQLRGLNDQAPFALQREIAAALSRENQLTQLYNEELQRAKTNDEFLVMEQQELDGIERLKTIHNSLVVRLNDWRLVEPGEGSVLGTKMSIIESPTIGAGPVWPKAPILLVLCAAMGLFCGIGTIAVLERDTWTNAGDEHSVSV